MKKSKTKFILSTKCSLNFTNTLHKNNLESFIDEYTKITQIFINILYSLNKIPCLIEKDIINPIKESTWLSARALQCCAKQASAIVRGTKQKQKQRLHIIEELKKEGKDYSKVEKAYNKAKVSCPVIKKCSPCLDYRFIKIDTIKKNSFDIWIELTSLGNKMKIKIPIKKTKHFNKLISNGKLIKSIIISKDFIIFSFEMHSIEKKIDGNIIGLDVGISNVFTTSDNQKSLNDIHNHNLTSIQRKLVRRKKSSKGFKRAQDHRKNYINWSLNQLNLKDIKQINIENLKDVHRGKKSSKFLKSWLYPLIQEKISRISYQSGVLVEKKCSNYTSQRCSCCGWTCLKNRNGKLFKCLKCNNTLDADYNASINLSLNLQKLDYKKYDNKNGFYWNIENNLVQEFIVPVSNQLNPF